jgi:hypothetical protein
MDELIAMGPVNPTKHETLPREPAIEEAIAGRFRGSPYLALRNIDSAYRDGVLRLWGCLPTYYLKQLAQETVAEVASLLTIVNEIEVMRSDASRMQ